MLFNGAVNATIVVWAARRSALKGFPLAGGLFFLSFFAQTFQTQIETAYFLPAFPLLHGNFKVYRLILRGAITCGSRRRTSKRSRISAPLRSLRWAAAPRRWRRFAISSRAQKRGSASS